MGVTFSLSSEEEDAEQQKLLAVAAAAHNSKTSSPNYNHNYNYKRSDSLQSDGPLETLLDFTTLITNRDANRRQQAYKKSAWRLDSFIHSPMLSSSTPRIMMSQSKVVEERREIRMEESRELMKQQKKIWKRMKRHNSYHEEQLNGDGNGKGHERNGNGNGKGEVLVVLGEEGGLLQPPNKHSYNNNNNETSQLTDDTSAISSSFIHGDIPPRISFQEQNHHHPRQQQQQQVVVDNDNDEEQEESMFHYQQTSPIKNEEDQWNQKQHNNTQSTTQSTHNNNNNKKTMTKSTSVDTTMSTQTTTTTTSSTIHLSDAETVEFIRQQFAQQSNPLHVSLMYGLVNFVIVLPVIMSFGNIIYQDEFFKPYLPVLVKLTVISSVVHQFCFCTFSTLPFAVGQVQDAGLIFLSSMAGSIVRYCKERDHTDEEILATSVIGLGLFTTILGICLVIIGRFKLAGYVRILPTSVIGGYLAFIGFFCGQSGMSLMSGVDVNSIFQWGNFFFKDLRTTSLVMPGFLGGLFIYMSVRKIQHMVVLPCCIGLLLGMFYLVLGLAGQDLDDARIDGWINKADEPPVWYKTWTYFKFDKVIWAALPPQTLTLISMILVVALSSSLDIAAIDLEMPMPLEYNYELRMVGMSNILSGLTGGYTGSYIFSQTIFSLRAGIRSRLSGYTIAVLELITVVIPISILNYIPNLIFGSLLVMICVDLMIEWLWDIRKKVTGAEYTVALSTFLLIQIWGVEYGIMLGVGVHFILLKLGFDVKMGDQHSSSSSNDDDGDDNHKDHYDNHNDVKERRLERGENDDDDNDGAFVIDTVKKNKQLHGDDDDDDDTEFPTVSDHGTYGAVDTEEEDDEEEEHNDGLVAIV